MSPDDDREFPFTGLAEGEQITEIPAEGVAVELDALEIHENYRFDVQRQQLVRKQPETTTQET